jgi:hypothetical protein
MLWRRREGKIRGPVAGVSEAAFVYGLQVEDLMRWQGEPSCLTVSLQNSTILRTLKVLKSKCHNIYATQSLY